MGHIEPSGDDLLFQDKQQTEIFRMDSSADSLLMAGTKKIEFTTANAYIHHDGTDLKLADDADINLVAGADVLLDAATTVKIDSDAGDISFEDGGTAQLSIDMDGTAGEIIIKTAVASDDLVFQNTAGQEQIRLSNTRGKMFLYDEGGEYLAE